MFARQQVAKFAAPGEFTEPAPLDPTIFGVALRKDIVHEVVRYQRAKVRQPRKTKRIGEIRGSGKKPRPQKGQGVGQIGNRRNSAWKGGQKAHGPVLRDFSIGLNRYAFLSFCLDHICSSSAI
jgi:large subunit ribosomal protein L4